MAGQTLGGQRADAAEECQPSRADCWWIWADRLHWSRSKLYAIAANHINQAVLGFTQTTTSFKKQQQLPRHISIPDILNMQGQVARCYAKTCFQKFVSDNLQRLKSLTEAYVIKEFAGLKLNLRQGFIATGMGDLQSKLLTVAEARKRQASIELQSKKHQKLTQAEQPRLIECAGIAV